MSSPTPLKANPKDIKAVLDTKAPAKAVLQKELGWPNEPKRPMICIPAGLTKDLGGELFEKLIDGLITLSVEIVILGKGSAEYGKLVTSLASKHKHQIAIIPNKAADKKRMYEAADMALFLGDPANLPELKEALDHGTVPVSLITDALESYNPVQESGNAFFYEKLNPWHCFAAVVRALETHVFPFDWKTIQKHCLGS